GDRPPAAKRPARRRGLRVPPGRSALSALRDSGRHRRAGRPQALLVPDLPARAGGLEAEAVEAVEVEVPEVVVARVAGVHALVAEIAAVGAHAVLEALGVGGGWDSRHAGEQRAGEHERADTPGPG